MSIVFSMFEKMQSRAYYIKGYIHYKNNGLSYSSIRCI